MKRVKIADQNWFLHHGISPANSTMKTTKKISFKISVVIPHPLYSTENCNFIMKFIFITIPTFFTSFGIQMRKGIRGHLPWVRNGSYHVELARTIRQRNVFYRTILIQYNFKYVPRRTFKDWTNRDEQK